MFNLSPIEMQRILVKRIRRTCGNTALSFFNNIIFFVCCCLILLDTLLFVSATASVSS